MGMLFSSLATLLWRSQKKHRIVIVGLDNAGKTTTLYKLHLGAPLRRCAAAQLHSWKACPVR
jgi:GTPase SAR1 family protein